MVSTCCQHLDNTLVTSARLDWDEMKVKRLKGRGVHLDSIIWKLRILFLNRMVVATAIPKLSLTNGHEVASLCHYGRDDPELNVISIYKWVSHLLIVRLKWSRSRSFFKLAFLGKFLAYHRIVTEIWWWLLHTRLSIRQIKWRKIAGRFSLLIPSPHDP